MGLVVEGWLLDGISLASPGAMACSQRTARARAADVQNGNSGGPTMAGDECREPLTARQALGLDSHPTTPPGID